VQVSKQAKVGFERLRRPARAPAGSASARVRTKAMEVVRSKLNKLRGLRQTGAKQQTDRVGRFSRLIRLLEEANQVRVELVESLGASASGCKDECVNPTGIKALAIKDRPVFYQEANKALMDTRDRKRTGIFNQKLCGGARETMRYLGLLPKDKAPDGKHDWSSGHFYFNAEAREARLEKGMRGNAGQLLGSKKKRKATDASDAASGSAAKCLCKGLRAEKKSG